MSESKDEPIKPEHRPAPFYGGTYPDGSRVIYDDALKCWYARKPSCSGVGYIGHENGGRATRFPTAESARAALYALGQGPASLPPIEEGKP